MSFSTKAVLKVTEKGGNKQLTETDSNNMLRVWNYSNKFIGKEMFFKASWPFMTVQICDESSQFAEGERPRPQGSSPVEEFPETEKYSDSDKEVQSNHILQY